MRRGKRKEERIGGKKEKTNLLSSKPLRGLNNQKLSDNVLSLFAHHVPAIHVEGVVGCEDLFEQ